MPAHIRSVFLWREWRRSEKNAFAHYFVKRWLAGKAFEDPCY
jgi:hypothetical protein